MSNLSIGKRISVLTIVSGILILVVAGVGWKNMSNAIIALESTYNDRLVPVSDLGKISDLLGGNTAEVLRAIQHDPRNPIHTAHDHPVSKHLDSFNQRRAEINALWDKYMATYLTEEEKKLAEDFVAKNKAWVEGFWLFGAHGRRRFLRETDSGHTCRRAHGVGCSR